MELPNENATAQLMARDPRGHSDVDIDQLIKELRGQRSRYVATDDKKIGTPAIRKTAGQKKKEAVATLAVDLNLDDLLSGL